MAFFPLRVNNVSNLTSGSSSSITGKNGFTTVLGSIPVLVDSYGLTDVTGSYAGNIQFTISTLNNLFDDNFYKHILNVNDGSFLGLKGFDYVNIPITEKSNTIAELGFVGYNPVITKFSANIVTFNVAANTIKIVNSLSSNIGLIDALPIAPFYVSLYQIIDSRYFANNIMYLEGTYKTFSKVYNLESVGASFNAGLGITPRNKIFISLYIDEIKQNDSAFTWTSGTNYINFNLSGIEKRARTVVEHYTVPTIEMGDNIFTIIGNTYSISQTSYSPSSLIYNVALTANSIYKIKIEQNLKANLTFVKGVNITKDIVGIIGNVNTTSNTFTVDYDNIAYPGNLELANNKIYKINAPLEFKKISLSSDKIIENVPEGINIVRARNINRLGRKSPYSTKIATVNYVPVQRVENLLITESLYRDTVQGVLVRVEISFDHIIGQDVIDYEISYHLHEEGETLLESLTTVKVSYLGADGSGKIRHTINNIDRGRTSSVRLFHVIITPITSTNIRGVPAELEQYIVGKTAAPLGLTSVTGSQQGENVIFTWLVPTNSDGTVVDIDLNEIEIRRASGTISNVDFLSQWIANEAYAKVATPASGTTKQITKYGTNTFLFRTKDTSGNYSDTINGVTLSTIRPFNIQVYKAWSDDDPTVNFYSGINNENSNEYYYPSFANSNSGGLSYSYTTRVDNSNGTSTGFTIIGGSPTDLLATANAMYQTQIRDIGEEVLGKVITELNSVSVISTTFVDFRENILTGVTENISQGNVLVDVDFGGIGSVLGYNNVNAATVSYDTYQRTLVSGPISGNVFAIWLNGQFVNDISNTNVWALIAGVINANAIALGNTFFANGISTGANILANLSANSTNYSLVNLLQFSDPGGEQTFAGQSGMVTVNTEIRYANGSVSVFYANGNVNSSAFIDGTTNYGWKAYSAIETRFRYFQLRYSLFNANPIGTDTVLDIINYTVDLPLKEFTSTINVNAYPRSVSYSSTGFIKQPTIKMTILANASLSTSVIDYSKTGANIAVFNTVTGASNTNVNILFEARGV